MARKTINFTIQDEGRDKGKVFVITEMPASKAEAWAMRALLALIQGGAHVPDGFERMGMAGMAEVGIRALSGLSWDIAKPLIDEMFDCIQIQPDPSRAHVVRNLIEEDIEEPLTRIKLRAEVWKLHTGFLSAVASFNSGESPAVAAEAESGLPSTKTSRRQ